MSYYYIKVCFVMRECDHAEDAVQRLSNMLPQNPDETTTSMESWSIDRVDCEWYSNVYHREDAGAEQRLDGLLARASLSDAEREARHG